MTTKDNTNYSVKELVAKYRNYVFEKAPQKDVSKFGLAIKSIPISNEDRYPDHQLIKKLYKTAIGVSTEKHNKNEYTEHFYKDALTENEFAYLCNHFSEAITELFTNGVHWGGSKERYDFLYSNKTEFDLTKEYIQPKEGSSMYITGSGCDVAELYPTCNIRMDYWGNGDRALPLAKIWLYDKNSNLDCTCWWSEGIGWGHLRTEKYFDYIICGSNFGGNHYTPSSIYEHLKPKGRMLYFATYEGMANQDEEFTKFRGTLVKDKAIVSIVAYPHLFTANDYKKGILLVIEKSEHDFVEIKSLKKNQSISIASEMLNPDILWPSYYLTSKPAQGKPLSSIVSIADYVYGYDYCKDLRKDGNDPDKSIQVIKMADLKSSYKDTNLIGKKLEHESLDELWCHKILCDNCFFLCGIHDIELGSGYFSSFPEDGIAIDYHHDPIVCLVPKKGIDIRYIVALLLSPDVKSYIISLCHNEVSSRTLPYILDKIIIPDHNEKERLQFLAEANYDAMLASQEELKKNHEDYQRGVRMRKHALTQSMSSIESMFNALNAYRKRQHGNIADSDCISRIKEFTVNDAFNFIEDSIKNIMPAIEHLAEVEYSYGEVKDIDPEVFINSYISKNKGGWNNFTVIRDKNDDLEKTYRPIIIKQADGKEKKYYPRLHFPKAALEQILNNIISNAQSHGFTDSNRDDYKIRISWHYDGINMIIKIENNGQPLPNDRSISSLFEYGVSTSLHIDGHNGIGLNEIEHIMNRFKGNVKIVPSPNDEYTVKYILTFPTNMVPGEDLELTEITKHNSQN